MSVKVEITTVMCVRCSCECSFIVSLRVACMSIFHFNLVGVNFIDRSVSPALRVPPKEIERMRNFGRCVARGSQPLAVVPFVIIHNEMAYEIRIHAK